jgi:hypothetical protein
VRRVGEERMGGDQRGQHEQASNYAGSHSHHVFSCAMDNHGVRNARAG